MSVQDSHAVERCATTCGEASPHPSWSVQLAQACCPQGFLRNLSIPLPPCITIPSAKPCAFNKLYHIVWWKLPFNWRSLYQERQLCCYYWCKSPRWTSWLPLLFHEDSLTLDIRFCQDVNHDATWDAKFFTKVIQINSFEVGILLTFQFSLQKSVNIFCATIHKLWPLTGGAWLTSSLTQDFTTYHSEE